MLKSHSYSKFCFCRAHSADRTDILLLSGVDVLVQTDDQILTCNMPDSDEGVAYESLDCEAVAMIEESPSVDGMKLTSSVPSSH